MFDYHMHSDFSADCNTPMEKTIESAIEKGLTEITFTEHIDYEYPDPTIVFDLDLEKYDRKIKQMQQKYNKQISLKKGVEIGVQPYLLERYHKLLKQEQFDFIICSMHTVNKQGLHSGDVFRDNTVEAAYQLYYEELLYCVENFDAYNILGHLDLVKRYKALDVDNNFHDIIQTIFDNIIPKGKGIEVNTSGFRYGIKNAMPSKDILQLYKDAGGEIITVGSDAHFADDVGYRVKEMYQLLDEIGFKYVATFTNREPEFHSIRQYI